MFKLFIDDERYPVDSSWVIARSSDEAIKICSAAGTFPDEIAFDHDLGGDDTSIRFISWMIDMIMDHGFVIPSGFKFSVHSQNPVGAANITSYMNNIIHHL